MSRYAWVRAEDGQIPPNAVEGGVDSDGNKIYIGKTRYEGNELPCRVYPHRKEAFTTCNNEEHKVTNYEVLCEQKFQWVPSSGGFAPPGAVLGGHTNYGEKLYIGRASHEGVVVVGKIHPSHGCLYIGSEGKEISYKQYEVLILH